jgi:hypothetical protein
VTRQLRELFDKYKNVQGQENHGPLFPDTVTVKKRFDVISISWFGGLGWVDTRISCRTVLTETLFEQDAEKRYSRALDIPGIEMYRIARIDNRGLPVYRTIRGTNVKWP